MSDIKKITFRVTGKISKKIEMSPAVFDIKKAKHLIDQIDKFVEAGLDTKKQPIGLLIEEGSWKAVILAPLFIAAPIQADIEAIEKGDFDKVHPIRLQIVSDLQKKYKNTDLTFSIGTKEKPDILKINKDTDYNFQDTWVDTEEILHGNVESLGGAQNPNFHLRTEKGSIVISANQEEIIDIQKNVPLYKQEIGVKVKTKQNIKTKENKDYKLVSYNLFSPKFDPEKLKRAIESGTKAWGNITDATKWVKSQRS